MAKFRLTYIKHGEYDGGEMPTMVIEAKDRWDAIREFRKAAGVKRISDLDYFYDQELEN